MTVLSPLRLALFALAFAGAARAGQYQNPDGSVSPGVVLESGGKPIGATNPSSVSVSNVPAVMDIELAAARGQRFFVASTNAQTVASGSFLNVTICNAVGSGKLVTVTERRFDSNLVGGAAPMQYGGIAGPAAIASPTIASTGTNTYATGPTSAAITMSAAVSSTRLNNAAGNATPTATGFIPTNGEPLKLLKPRLLPPGQCMGQFIVGANQAATGLTGGASAGLTIYWTEEAQ